MNLWERLLGLAKSQDIPELPQLSPDLGLWGRTLEAHTRLDRQLVLHTQLETVVKALTDEFEQFKASSQAEIGKLRLQVEVLKAHDTRRGNG